MDRKGNVYVADFYNHRIQKFSGSGELLGKLGSRPSSDRQLQYPAGVAADPTGRIYVSDFFANHIWKAKCDGPG